jgi:uncharacterized protein (TIGR02271 family)
MANENREHRDRIAPLSDLSDFEVSDHDPDVRGWDVMSSDGRKIGEVEDLIVDTGAMKVRYLDIEVDKDFRADDDNRRILIPVGHARLHEDEDHVHVSSLSSTDVRAFPAYRGDLNPTYEASVHRHFGGEATTSFDDSSFYGARRGTGRGAGRGTGRTAGRGTGEQEGRMTLSEEELRVGREKRDAGEVRVGKHVETEHVSKDVPVTRERASIERRPIEGSEARDARASISEDEVRVPLSEEEVVVEKRVVPKEEIVVKKHREQDTKHVEADVRRERADIDRGGKPGDRDRNRNP